MKLYYFDIYGRAESIRFLAAHAKVPIETVLVSNDVVPSPNGQPIAALKETGILEFGQVPVLEVDGKHLAQSWAILRFLGRQHGYYPSDADAAYQVDSTIDAVEDFLGSYFKFMFEHDAERKKAAKETFLTKFLPNWLNAIEKRITKNSSQKYIVGDKMTIADFALGNVGFNILLNEANPSYGDTWEIIKDREVLKAYANSQKEELKEYLASRPQPRPF